jgi:hypothetical protein
MIRTRTENTATVGGARDEDQAVTASAEDGTGTHVPDSLPGPLTDDATPGESTPPDLPVMLSDLATIAEVTAAADAGRQRLAEAQKRQEQALAQAGQVEAGTVAEIERMKAATRTEVSRLRWTVAPAAGRDAEKESAFIAELDGAVREKNQAIEVAAGLEQLAGEHQGLVARIESLDTKLAALDTKRQDLEGSRTAARTAGDDEAITDLLGRLAGVEEARTSLTRQRDDAAARRDELADSEGNGEIGRLLAKGQRHLAEARKLMNLAFPGRQEDLEDKAAGRLALVAEAILEAGARMREEQRKPQGQPDVQVQHIGNTTVVTRR